MEKSTFLLCNNFKKLKISMEFSISDKYNGPYKKNERKI